MPEFDHQVAFLLLDVEKRIVLFSNAFSLNLDANNHK